MRYLRYLFTSKKQRPTLIGFLVFTLIAVVCSFIWRYPVWYSLVPLPIFFGAFLYAAYPNYLEDLRTGNWK